MEGRGGVGGRGGERVRRRVVAVGGGGVLLVGLVGCGGVDAGAVDAERRVFAFSGSALTVDSDNTSVRVVPADVTRVEVSRQVDGWGVVGSGPRKSWGLTDGRLTLRVDCSGVVKHCEARHTVKVPRGVAVTVRNDNGTVTASGFTTPLAVVSDNGNVIVRDTEGPLDLRSDNGAIVTKGVRATTLKARTDNGRVRIRLGAGAVPERMDLASHNGSIRVDLPRAGAPYAVDARSGNGPVVVDVPQDPDGARTVRARSDNGAITVRGV
ncbi:DUF4097 family beta strand repeat protein [Streptomyces clavuligerus]|nr:hypothetical protein D1794_21095 [Streptomyces clavuligerus]MBY6305055.1 DUF4097 family beta strand repeat protein [Streptomyces clavuligerus]QCS07776.1 hypothetical protein CRV15_20460 [Streptomyces clavuligerus]QPJ92879.1 hypothetical protein GE265_07625 [Streptomyces clavuligerus]QPL65011.1 DUF4097 family beta strand repeat protein [Streptomyces clavuligerus]